MATPPFISVFTSLEEMTLEGHFEVEPRGTDPYINWSIDVDSITMESYWDEFIGHIS